MLRFSEESKQIVTVKDDCKITDFLSGASFQAEPGESQQRYILTGGPGAGKTSILNYLATLGFGTVREAATDIIEDDLKKNIQKPWKADDYHLRIYDLMSKRQFEAKKTSNPFIFFDRGHLDSISYILLQKRKLYQYVVDCVQATINEQYFNKSVFFIESLGFVVPGPARDESLEESIQKANCLRANYLSLGYEIVSIPPGTVQKRAQMIIDYIQK